MMILAISIFAVGPVSAANCSLKLPNKPVTLTVVDGIDSFFISTLSNVPPGSDVGNMDYPGWCVDLRYDVPTTIQVRLYPSCDPPKMLSTERWDMVNYILNNKQGTARDIQEAIWYFVKMKGDVGEWQDGYTPTTEAQAMVNDALAHGDGFVPGPFDTIAVICVPLTEEQITIIELIKGTGKVTGGGQIEIEGGKASFGFNAMWFSRNVNPNGEIEFVNHVTGDKVHAHPLTYLIVETPNPGNKPWPMLEAYFEGTCTFNHEEGYTFWVYVMDDGEPKNPDYFSIEVRDGAGNIVVEATAANYLLHGNIQIHKPPK